MSWEPVIGLEVHVQLNTSEKLFCPDATTFAAPPNTQICPVCLGLPGALPVLNREAVDLAITAALGLGCRIHQSSVFARKSYFYPDLPKGYQITQFEEPLATDGSVLVTSGAVAHRVRIRRVSPRGGCRQVDSRPDRGGNGRRPESRRRAPRGDRDRARPR